MAKNWHYILCGRIFKFSTSSILSDVTMSDTRILDSTQNVIVHLNSVLYQSGTRICPSQVNAKDQTKLGLIASLLLVQYTLPGCLSLVSSTSRALSAKRSMIFATSFNEMTSRQKFLFVICKQEVKVHHASNRGQVNSKVIPPAQSTQRYFFRN